MHEDLGDERLNGRFGRLAKIAGDVIEELQERDGAAAPAVFLNKERLASCVRHHFEQIDSYKTDHQFPDGFANFPKVAAFTVLSIMEHEPLQLAEGQSPTTLTVLANVFYAREAVISMMFIDPDSIPIEVDEWLLYTIHFSKPSIEWMVLATDLFQRLYQSAKFKNLIDAVEADVFGD